MPTILRSGPYRVYFYSHEMNEPARVHVDRDAASCKFWLSPVALASNLGFRAHELRTIERLIEIPSTSFWTSGRLSMATQGERVTNVHCTDDCLVVDLADGRTISAPLAWYPRLLHATPEQRANWQVAGAGYGIHWPEIDEDISVEGLLRGAPAPRPSAKAS